MRGFIEIRNEYGNKILVNIKYIEEVREHPDDTCTIYLAFTCPDANEQDHYEINKPYEEIISLIEKAVQDD